MEEGEEEGGDDCCAYDVLKFTRRGVSVLAMGPSCGIGSRDEARLSGRTGNKLASAWSTHPVPDRIDTSIG